MAENKIPVLTEVYQPKGKAKNPKQDSGATNVSADLIAQLREEIKKDVLVSLQADMQQSEQSIVNATKDFIDKTKADFKTELPAMHQQSVKLAEVGLTEQLSSLQNDLTKEFSASLADISKEASSEAFVEVQRNASVRIEQEIKEEITAFKTKAVSEHQAELSETMQAQSIKMNEESKKVLESSLEATQAQLLAEQNEQLAQLLNSEIETYKESTKGSIEEHKQILDSELAVHKEYAKNTLEQYTQSFQEKALSELKLELSNMLPATLDTLIQDAEITFKEKVNSLQREVYDTALAQTNQQLTDAVPDVIAQMMDEVKVKFNQELLEQTQNIKNNMVNELNAELPEAQQILSDNIEKVLENTIPVVEHALRQKLQDDIQALLLDVKFVLP